MRIRVIRVLEYEYEDEETYERDRARWTCGANMAHMKMKSAVIPVDFLREDRIDLEFPDEPTQTS